jgi:hypothetical protein
MKSVLWLPIFGLVGLLAAGSSAWGQQTPYIGYAFPAGGQQGTTFQVRLGGQRIDGVTDAVVSGTGVSARLVDYRKQLSNQEVTLLREQLRLLKQQTRKQTKKDVEQEELIARIEKRVKEWVNRPACAALSSIAIVEVTVDADAKPGPRDLRLVTARGLTNPLVFYVGQVPEYVRKPMLTCPLQVLGKEQFSLRKRPEEEVEMRVTVPCTMNGQIASGEVNHYRFEAQAGQKLVVSVTARELIPFIADAVPGWFQPVVALYDAEGNELAFNDDYRFKPDPTLCFDVPADGEYVLKINDAIYRGREDFVYRITIGELPFATSIFPLGGRVGEPVAVEMKGWNLEGAELSLPNADAEPGVYWITANCGGQETNRLPFDRSTLPEMFDQETRGDSTRPQRVELPVVVNGRINQPDDWDVFEVNGRAGQRIVAEVSARRLDSPLDSMLRITDAAGNLVGLNDDHEDPAAGINTHHADSYLMVQLPADGKYLVHIGDTARSGGEAYAYRLRISQPRPDFELRVVASSASFRSRSNSALTVHAIRKDGFAGDIRLRLKDPPKGFTSRGVTLKADKESVRLGLKTTLWRTPQPVLLTVEGVAQIRGAEVAHEAVPAEDRMQAFLWRHLVPAEDLVAVVYNPAYKPASTRVPDPTAGLEPGGVVPGRKVAGKKVAGKKVAPPQFNKRQVAGRLRQLKALYEEWLLTDAFYNIKVAECQTVLD